MAAIDFPYDAKAELESNYQQGVLFDIVDRGIVPIDGPFYEDDFFVEARLNNGPWTELTVGTDYAFSPLFLPVAAATGKMVHRYIVLKYTDMSLYTSLRINMRLVGQYEDSALLAKVAELSAPDRMKVFKWMKLKESFSYPVDTRDPSLHNRPVLEVVNSGLANIKASLDSLQRTGASNFDVVAGRLEQKYTQFEEQLNQILNGGQEGEAAEEDGDVIFATFISMLGTSRSNTYRPYRAMNYRYLDIWLDNGSAHPSDIPVNVYVDGISVTTGTLLAGDSSVRITLDTPIAVTFSNTIELEVSNQDAQAVTVHTRLLQKNL